MLFTCSPILSAQSIHENIALTKKRIIPYISIFPYVMKQEATRIRTGDYDGNHYYSGTVATSRTSQFHKELTIPKLEYLYGTGVAAGVRIPQTIFGVHVHHAIEYSYYSSNFKGETNTPFSGLIMKETKIVTNNINYNLHLLVHKIVQPYLLLGYGITSLTEKNGVTSYNFHFPNGAFSYDSITSKDAYFEFNGCNLGIGCGIKASNHLIFNFGITAYCRKLDYVKEDGAGELKLDKPLSNVAGMLSLGINVLF